MIRRAVPLALLSACVTGTVDPGTAVGNPPDAMVRLAPTPSIGVTASSLSSAILGIAPCDLTLPVEEIVLGDLDLVGGWPIALPEGEICGGRLSTVTLEVDFIADDGSAGTAALMDLEIDLGPDDPDQLPRFGAGDRYILELGGPGWMTDLQSPEVAPYTAAKARILAESALWDDPDESGTIETSERLVPALDAGQPPLREAEAEDDDD